MPLTNQQEIEFKVYGFYSQVAKQLDTTIDAVDTVYSWYTDNIIKELETSSARKVFLQKLGILKFDIVRGTEGLGRAVFTLNKSYEKHLLGTPTKNSDRVSKSYLVSRYEETIEGIAAFRERLRLHLESESITLKRFELAEKRLQKIETDLEKLYEKIKRIPDSSK